MNPCIDATPAPNVTSTLLFFVLPLVLIYISLLVWSSKKDRFK